MLKGSSSSQSKIFHLTSNDSLIPEDSIQAILIEVENALKSVASIDEHMMVTVQHQQMPWKFMIILKDSHKPGKKIKLKNVDLYFIDENTILGEGSQGKVALAQHIPSGTFAAAKIQIPSSPSFDYDLNVERRNLSMTERLYGYAKVVPTDEDLVKDLPEEYTPDQLEGARAKNTVYYTLMKHFQGRNLNEFLYEIDRSQSKDSPAYFAEKRQLDIASIGKLAVYAIQEVLNLHDLGLAHRDIKADNYVLNTTGLLQECSALRLIDLGTALLSDSERSKDDASTFGYMPPEYLVDGKDRPHWDKVCDYFQLGIVLAEILTKSNYQAGLKKLALDQAAEAEKKHLPFDAIKELMPDAFAIVKKRKRKAKENASAKSSPVETEKALTHELLYCLHNLIHLLTNPDRVSRAQIDLKTLFSELRSIHGRASTVIQLNNSQQRFLAYKMKRQNTQLDLKKVKQASNSNAAMSSSSSSVSFQLPKDTALDSPKQLRRRKSADLIQSPVVEIKEQDGSMTERPSRSKSTSDPRKRSVSSSSHQVKKIEGSPKPKGSATADLIQQLGDLTLESEQDKVIRKLAKVCKRVKLMESSPASSNEQVVMSDFLMFSLLGKRLTSAVEEKSPDRQRIQLNGIAKIAQHYVPSKNEPLNQEMAKVSKLLTNYPK